MQETEFIAQNKEKWNEFEEVLKSKDKDPDRLTSLFVEMTDDLSYAQTNYPNRSVKVYLNGVSQKIHTAIYKNKRDRKSNRKGFWSVELPAALWAARKPLLYAFVLFTLGISIGVFSDMYYPEFARIVLSDGYVEMTEQFIKDGDPMQVYKDRDQLEMFFMIAINNIQISLGAFVLGILWGVGTAYVLLSNGIMFGAFMHFFFKRDLGTESVLTVMQHGTLELSMIVISGAAGFMIAKGILFPGTYTRLESMVMQARHAIKVMIPVFILLLYAAFIESFLTRYTELPNALRAFSIFLSAAIVLGYFVWYPYHQNKKGVFNKIKEEEIPIGNKSLPKLDKIKPTSVIFNETFSVFYTVSKPIASIALVIGILITFALGLNADWTYSNYFNYNNISDFNVLYFLWYWTPYIALTSENSALLFYGLYGPAIATSIVSYFIIVSKAFGHAIPKNIILQFFNALLISLVVLLSLELPDVISFLILIFLWPVCLLWLSAAWNEQNFLFSSKYNFGSLVRHNFGKTLANFWNIQGIQWITLLILNGSILTIFGIIFTGRPVNLLWVFLEFIQMNIPRNWSFSAEVPYFTYTLILIFGLLFVLSFSIISTYLIFFSAKEISSSESLLQSIQNIGTKKRAYGIEKEA
jgi:uncharacterized membrane protein SpoIIM required for sporulation